MYNNPYYNQQQRFQSIPTPPMQTQPYIPPMQPIQQIGLLGKVVDSIEVVKAMDIPLDGSVSYFPLTDGSAIVSKQLQNDGTSKTIVYKPYVEQKKEDKVERFVTFEEFDNAIGGIDLSELQDLKDEIEELKKQLKDIRTKKGREN